MDDTAQTSSVQSTAQPTQAQDPVQTPSSTQPQPINRPVEPPQGGSRGVEQGPARSSMPAREAAPMDEADAVPPAASDDSSDVVDDQTESAAPAEAPAAEQTIEVQTSHPEVELPEAVKAVGVDVGPDAKKEQLPEEKQVIDIPDSPEQMQANAKQAIAASLPDYQQALQDKKTWPIHSARKWLADLVKRQWEIIQGKPK